MINIPKLLVLFVFSSVTLLSQNSSTIHPVSNIQNNGISFIGDLLPTERFNKTHVSIVPRVPIYTIEEINTYDYLRVSTKKVFLDRDDNILRQINFRNSPTENTTVSYTTYSNFGKPLNNYLPYVDIEYPTNSLPGIDDPSSSQQTFYSNFDDTQGENYLYSRSIYERNPSSQISEQYKPGNAWNGAEVGIFFGERLNFTSYPHWVVDPVSGAISNIGFYADYELIVKISYDEDKNVKREYYNGINQLLFSEITQVNCLTTTGGGGQDPGDPEPDPGNPGTGRLINCTDIVPPLRTDYVYDVFGRLSAVLSPKAVIAIQSEGWDINPTVLNELCFQYKYDFRSRVTGKKVPGKSWEWMVYDKFGRIVLSTDELLLGDQHTWRFVKYDALGRNIQTGFCELNYNAIELQQFFDGTISVPVGSWVGYLKNPNEVVFDEYQTGTADIRQTQFYDNYEFQSSTAFDLSRMPQDEEAYNPEFLESAWRRNTGSITKVPDLTQDLLSVNFYDDEGFSIQFYSQQLTGGFSVQSQTRNFTNNIRRSALYHENPSSQSSSLLLDKEFDYDFAGRLLRINQRIGSDDYSHLIVAYQYDELGRVKQKRIGENSERQDFNYNIQGWTTGINRSFSDHGGNDHVFGMRINYEGGSANHFFNGRISDVHWRNKGSVGLERLYNYSYDHYQRLMNAEYLQSGLQRLPEGVDIDPYSFTNLNTDYSVPDIRYDANGNITKMVQLGMHGQQKIRMDDLQYVYENNSNKLKSVTEASSSQSTDPIDLSDGRGDFRDTPGEVDYGYDINGNIQFDNNRLISSIEMDKWVNKPKEITFNDGKKITYIYDASGNKLKKIVEDPSNTQNNVETDYSSIYVFENNILQYQSHEEGRVRYNFENGESIAYEFDIKDYLNNVRAIVSETEDKRQAGDDDPKNKMEYTATSELPVANVEQELFYNVEETRAEKPQSCDELDLKSSKTNAAENKPIGAGIMLKVMAGDEYSLEVEAFFSSIGDNQPISNPEQILSGIATAMTGGDVIQSTELAAKLTEVNGQQILNLISSLNDTQQDDNINNSSPNAFINYLAFDEGLHVLPQYSGAIKVNTSDQWHTLAKELDTLEHSGYIYIYSSNSSAKTVNFDNLKVKLFYGQLKSEFHYYPFGLTVNLSQAIDVKDAPNLYTDQKFERNEFSDGKGLNMYDFEARMYDQQIGRWNSADPMAENRNWLSTYNFCQNNPISRVDPSGAIDDWVKNNETNEYVWKDDVHEIADTPKGYSYVGKNDQSILKDLGIPSTMVEMTNNIGWIYAEAAEGFQFATTTHMVNLKNQISVSVTAEVSFNNNIDRSNNQNGYKFDGLSVNASVVSGMTLSEGNIKAVGNLRVAAGGKEFSSFLQSTDKSSVWTKGSSLTTANINIPAINIYKGYGISINVSGGWGVTNGSGFYLPVVNHALIPTRSIFHESWNYTSKSLNFKP